MSLFKRISVAVSSQLDAAVSRIENHDAVIEAALQESRDAIARLEVQQSRTRQELEQLDRHRRQLKQDQQDWLRRAKTLARDDEARALACLERRDRCREQAERLHRQQEQCANLQLQLADKLSGLRQRLAADEQRLRELRGRDLVARAELGLREAHADGPGDLQRGFERWELDITRAELRTESPTPCAVDGDPLEQRLRREEELTARRAELQSLLQEERP